MNVSIIIPAYNAAETIAETLESVRAQSSPDWEALVVDDGSRDATARLVRGFGKRDARVRLIQRPNGGEAAARNSGIAAARFDWLLFLDADDWIAAEHLERLTGVLAADPGLAAVHCRSARVAPDGTVLVEPFHPPAGDLFAIWARRSAFPVHACIVRKALVEAVGGFDATLQKSPDWDLWQRVARTGARFGAVDEVLAYYRMRPQAASLEAREMLRDGLRVLRQGHAPDPRVVTPHPDHAAGAPPAGIATQAFYLLSWCAGLLLGREEDARPLLEAVADLHFPELHAESVARCLFDAAPLPSCETPAAWERLWPKIRGRVEEFLAALEAQARAPELAGRAGVALMRLALEQSPAWQPAVSDLERQLEDASLRRTELERSAEDLAREREGRHLERATLEQALEAQAASLDEQRRAVQDQNAVIEEQRRALQDQNAVIEEQRRAVQDQSALLDELRQSLAERNTTVRALRDELRESHRVGADRDQTIHQHRAALDTLTHAHEALQRRAEEREQSLTVLRESLQSLEQEHQRVAAARTEWQQTGYELERALAQLRGAFWVRLGLRLGVLRHADTAVTPVSGAPQGIPDQGAHGDWSLRLDRGNRAVLEFPPHDPTLIRVAIGQVSGRRRWDIQLNRGGFSAVAQGEYRVRFRARADRPRRIVVGFAQAHEPWKGLGLYRVINLSRDWESHELRFRATANDASARLHFDFGGNGSAVELAGVEVLRVSGEEPGDSTPGER